MFWRRALFNQNEIVFFKVHALLIGFCLSAVHGMLDEAYQMSVPGRSADVYDAAADIAGAGLFVLWFKLRNRSRRQENLT
jgi:VanZ family protein